MSVESVKAAFKAHGLEGLVSDNKVIADTVEHAARMYGCEPKQIAKTMSFLVHEQAMVVVMAGDAKIDNAKYKACFHAKAKLIPFAEVQEITTHEPGGVGPFGLPENVKVYLDVSLKRFAVVYAGAGDEYHTVGVTIPQLEEVSGSRKWVDVCKGWE